MDQSPDLLGMTSDVVAAFVTRNQVRPQDLPGLIRAVHAALTHAGRRRAGGTAPAPRPTAVQIRRSIRPEALISFEDGRPYKTLKRHLTTRGLTFAAYQQKWGLPDDYPSVAPEYAARRSALAKAAGLGGNTRTGMSRPAHRVR